MNEIELLRTIDQIVDIADRFANGACMFRVVPEGTTGREIDLINAELERRGCASRAIAPEDASAGWHAAAEACDQAGSIGSP